MRAKLESYFKKHAPLLVFFGTLIVFFTFVFKEGLSDYWNRLAEAIDTAQYMYSVRADTSAETQHFERLLREIQETQGLVRSRGKELPSGEETILENVGRAEIGNGEVSTSLSALRTLVDKLPNQDTNRVKLAELSKRVQEIQNDALDIVRLATPAGLRGSRNDRTKQLNESISHAVDLEECLFLKLGELREDSETLVANVLNDAEDVRKRNSTYSKAAWWISAVLFAFGSGLGLLGKLYGVPGAVGS